MKKIILMSVCILILGISSNVKAQFSFIHFNTNNSTIPSDFVLGGIAVDTNNNIWIGTSEGVGKYNGTTWIVYDTSNTPNLADDFITCIAVDHNNNIWIGTGGYGISKFDGTTWTTYTRHSTNDGINDSLCNNSIYYIAGDIDGSVWFASYGSGVSKLTGSTFTNYSAGLPMDGGVTAAVNYITFDDLGNKWFGTDKGLSKYDGSTFTTYDRIAIDSLLDDKILTIAIDSNNNKWIGTLNGVTKLSSSNTWVGNYRLQDGLYNLSTKDIKIDSEGNIWLGCYTDYNMDGGITKYDGISWVSQQISPSLDSSSNQIFRLAVDHNNNIWMALDYGVYKLTDQTGITENIQNHTFSIYPNPTSDVVNISISDPKNIQTNVIEIYDVLLQKLAEFQISETTKDFISFPLNEYQNGIYFIKAGNTVQKVILNK